MKSALLVLLFMPSLLLAQYSIVWDFNESAEGWGNAGGGRDINVSWSQTDSALLLSYIDGGNVSSDLYFPQMKITRKFDADLYPYLEFFYEAVNWPTDQPVMVRIGFNESAASNYNIYSDVIIDPMQNYVCVNIEECRNVSLGGGHPYTGEIESITIDFPKTTTETNALAEVGWHNIASTKITKIILTDYPSIKEDTFEIPEVVEHVDIFLLMGQSNMKGIGKIPENQEIHPRIINMNMADNNWYPALHPLHKAGVPDLIDSSDNAGVGPGLDFALGLANTDTTALIALIPCAIGGSNIAPWLKGAPLYEEAIKRARIAINDFPKDMVNIKGVLWLQGESDAKEGRYQVYESNLINMVKSLREDLILPDLPFYACTIGTFIDTSIWVGFDYFDEINDILLHAGDSISNYICIDARDLKGHCGDFIHYNTGSQQEIGKRYAQAYIDPTKLDSLYNAYEDSISSVGENGDPIIWDFNEDSEGWHDLGDGRDVRLLWSKDDSAIVLTYVDRTPSPEQGPQLWFPQIQADITFDSDLHPYCEIYFEAINWPTTIPAKFTLEFGREDGSKTYAFADFDPLSGYISVDINANSTAWGAGPDSYHGEMKYVKLELPHNQSAPNAEDWFGASTRIYKILLTDTLQHHQENLDYKKKWTFDNDMEGWVRKVANSDINLSHANGGLLVEYVDNKAPQLKLSNPKIVMPSTYIPADSVKSFEMDFTVHSLPVNAERLPVLLQLVLGGKTCNSYFDIDISKGNALVDIRSHLQAGSVPLEDTIYRIEVEFPYYNCGGIDATDWFNEASILINRIELSLKQGDIKPVRIKNFITDVEEALFYPNPAQSYFFFSEDINAVKSISIYNITGKIVKQINKKVNKIYINDLPAGVYIVSIDLLNGSDKKGKLVIE